MQTVYTKKEMGSGYSGEGYREEVTEMHGEFYDRYDDGNYKKMDALLKKFANKYDDSKKEYKKVDSDQELLNWMHNYKLAHPKDFKELMKEIKKT